MYVLCVSRTWQSSIVYYILSVSLPLVWSSTQCFSQICLILWNEPRLRFFRNRFSNVWIKKKKKSSACAFSCMSWIKLGSDSRMYTPVSPSVHDMEAIICHWGVGSGWGSFSVEDVHLVELMYLVFTRVTGDIYRRRFRSLLLCPLSVEQHDFLVDYYFLVDYTSTL